MHAVSSFTHPVRLGVWAGDGNNRHFLDPILDRLPPRYEVHRFVWAGDQSNDQNLRRMAAELETVDAAWLEWATLPAIVGSRLTRELPTVCRLHRYEAYGQNPLHITWENIDRLVFVSKGVEETFRHLHKSIVPRLRVTEVIPNGIAVENFRLKEDSSRGFNVAFLGRMHAVKNPMLLVQLMARLVQEDPRFRLHVAGQVQDYAVMQYMAYHLEHAGLQSHCVFHGGLKPDQVQAWLARQHYIVSSSIIEGHPVGVMEAMAVGLKPIIHDFIGARDIFPKEYLFNTIDEAVAMIREDDYRPASYRQFIEDHYTITHQVNAVTRMLDELVKVYYPERVQKPMKAAS